MRATPRGNDDEKIGLLFQFCGFSVSAAAFSQPIFLHFFIILYYARAVQAHRYFTVKGIKENKVQKKKEKKYKVLRQFYLKASINKMAKLFLGVKSIWNKTFDGFAVMECHGQYAMSVQFTNP